MKLKLNSKQIISALFILIMVGSTVSYAILSIFGSSSNNQTQIPNQQILSYRLTPEQQRYLLQRYYTLVDYSYPSSCIDCGVQKSELERLTQNSDNQIFLQEVVSDEVTSPLVIITSLKGQKTISNYTSEEVQTTLCDLLISRPLWCVSGQI